MYSFFTGCCHPWSYKKTIWTLYSWRKSRKHRLRNHIDISWFGHPFWHHFVNLLACFSSLFQHRILHLFWDAFFHGFWLHSGSLCFIFSMFEWRWNEHDPKRDPKWTKKASEKKGWIFQLIGSPFWDHFGFHVGSQDGLETGPKGLQKLLQKMTQQKVTGGSAESCE